jgi:hypothetical protein
MISCLALSHQAVVLNRIFYSTNKIFKIRRYLDQICRRTKAPQSAQPESNPNPSGSTNPTGQSPSSENPSSPESSGNGDGSGQSGAGVVVSRYLQLRIHTFTFT